MIIKYLFKIFFKQSSGKYRKTFIFPILSIIIGSYIIFMTITIMESMENTILKRAQSFDYEFYTENLNNNDINKLYNEKLLLNEGYSENIILSNNLENQIVHLNVYKYIENYFNDLSEEYFISIDKSIRENFIYLGKDLAYDLNLNLGDSVTVKFPSKINIVTRNIPSKRFILGGIFDYSIYDYDSRYAIASLVDCKDLIGSNGTIQYYIDDKTKFNIVKQKHSSIKLLVESLRLEKYIYTSLGMLVILSSALMFFNIMMLSYMEKDKQISVLALLGINNTTLIKFIFIKNMILSFLFISIGYIFMELSILLNTHIGLLNYIFNTFPFEISSMQLPFIKVILIILSLTSIITFSGVLPLILKINSKYTFSYDKN